MIIRDFPYRLHLCDCTCRDDRKAVFLTSRRSPNASVPRLTDGRLDLLDFSTLLLSRSSHTLKPSPQVLYLPSKVPQQPVPPKPPSRRPLKP